VQNFVLFRVDGPRGDGVYTIGTVNLNFVTALGGGGRSTEAFHTDARQADTWEYFHVLKSGDLGDGYNCHSSGGTRFVPGQGNNPRFISATGGGGRIKLRQIAPNVTMDRWAILGDCRYLLHDRDTKYTDSFLAIIHPA
jgi:hypothetical protein